VLTRSLSIDGASNTSCQDDHKKGTKEKEFFDVQKLKLNFKEENQILKQKKEEKPNKRKREEVKKSKERSKRRKKLATTQNRNK